MEGDLFDPVRGQTFDRITANPPFVPSPMNTLRFRDGGPSGEDIQKRIVAGLPHHLAPAGIAQIVTELGQRDGEPITGRLRDWLGGAPMDNLCAERRQPYRGRIRRRPCPRRRLRVLPGFHPRVGGQSSGARLLASRLSAGLIPVELRRRAVGAHRRVAAPAALRRRRDRGHLSGRGTRPEPGLAPASGRDLEGRRLRRCGPIARLDASVLGVSIPPKSKATWLGQALAIEHELEPVERQVLDGMEGTVAASELLRPGGAFDAPEVSVLETIRSLLRKRLVSVEAPPAEPASGR